MGIGRIQSKCSGIEFLPCSWVVASSTPYDLLHIIVEGCDGYYGRIELDAAGLRLGSGCNTTYGFQVYPQQSGTELHTCGSIITTAYLKHMSFQLNLWKMRKDGLWLSSLAIGVIPFDTRYAKTNARIYAKRWYLGFNSTDSSPDSVCASSTCSYAASRGAASCSQPIVKTVNAYDDGTLTIT